jgi:4-hydroxybenzoyl-CoA reductase subunit beta
MLRLHDFEYHRPRAIDDALRLLDRHAGDAMLIAGGTDVMPNMKHGLFQPAHVISLRSLPELHGVAERDGWLEIGAAESLAAVSRDARVRRHAPSLAQAAGSVAGPQLRNMGTLGGNLCLDTRCTYYNQTYFWRESLGFCLKKDGDTCHVTRVGRKCVAANSADTPPALMTLGAEAVLSSPAGERVVPVADFFLADGICNSVRRSDEIVTRIRIPLAPPGLRAGFAKLRQRQSIDFPLLNIAVALDIEQAVIRGIRVVVSALGARPRMLTGLDKIALDRELTDDVVEAIAERAYQQCHPLTNIIVDPEWRRAMVPVHVRRLLQEVMRTPQPQPG